MKSSKLSLLLFLLLTPLILHTQNRGMKSVQQELTEKRVALVIGNAAYTDAPLRNPVNDARLVAATLKNLGFKVISGENLSQKEMKKIIREFGQEIKSSGVGLFYYAGHGIQSNGRNYLIPLGADITKEQDIDLDAVDAGYALAEMEAAQNRMNILILDACRNNPFGRSYRSANRGLAQMTAPTGTFIAYSTAPGALAADGDGANGLYTQELVREVKTSGAKLEEVFKAVLSNVKQASGGKQVPWTASSVEGEFYFVPEVNPAPLNATARREEELRNGWADSLKKMQDEYQDIINYAKRNVSARLMASGWSQFVAKYSKDNPYSTDDDILREKAHSQLVYWERLVEADSAGRGTTSSANLPMIVNSIGMEFVLVQPGTFQMGSEDGKNDEMPMHVVTISRPYYVGICEVTQAQWQAVMDNDPSHTQRETRPVECISWNDAQEFVRKLNEREDGVRYRLPTEAEWEFAARGGSLSQGYKYAGSHDASDVAVYYSFFFPRTRPVGKKKPNELGIYDMSGNVTEWCEDLYGEYASGKLIDPAGLASGQFRVLRGGSWLGSDEECRVSARACLEPSDATNGTGFRLVRELK